MWDLTFSTIPPILTLQADFFTLSHVLENDQEEALRAAVETVMSPSIRKNFEVGGRPAWEPLADATVTHSKRRGFGSRPLIASGALMRNASSVSVWAIRDQEARLEAGRLGDAFYGRYHQDGTRLMPAREWAAIQPEDDERIQEIFEGWVTSAVGRTGWVTSAVGVVSRFFGRGRGR